MPTMVYSPPSLNFGVTRCRWRTLGMILLCCLVVTSVRGEERAEQRQRRLDHIVDASMGSEGDVARGEDNSDDDQDLEQFVNSTEYKNVTVDLSVNAAGGSDTDAPSTTATNETAVVEQLSTPTEQPTPSPEMTSVIETEEPNAASPTLTPTVDSATDEPVVALAVATARPTLATPPVDDPDPLRPDESPIFEPTLRPSKHHSQNRVDVLEQDAMDIVDDKNVRIVSALFGFLSLALLICVAQQMVENPDGCCAKVCRGAVACGRLVCCCYRPKSRRTHELVRDYDDYDHDLVLQ